MSDYQALVKARSLGDEAVLQAEVSSLPPGYIAGFEVTLTTDKQVVVGPGIASVQGRQVNLKESYQIVEGDWLSLKVGPQTFYIYLTSIGEYKVDRTVPWYDSDWHANYHPELNYRVVGKIYVDGAGAVIRASKMTLAIQNGDIVEADILGEDLAFVNGISSQDSDAPQEDDERSYLRRGALGLDKYLGGDWQSLFKVDDGAAANLKDVSVSGRVFANDSVLSALGRQWFQPTRFGAAAGYPQDKGLAFGLNGVGVALIKNGAAQVLYKTTDGMSFSSFASPFGAGYWAEAVVTDGNGTWVMTAYKSGANWQLAYSIDNAANWTLSGLATNGAIDAWPSYSGSKWMILDLNGYVTTSLDGQNWTSLAATTLPILTSGGLLYGDKWIAWQEAGAYLYFSSDDGKTWTAGPNTIFGAGHDMYCAAFHEGVLICGGNSTSIARSTDGGATFSLIALPVTTNVRVLVAGAGIFVAGSAVLGATAARSLDLGLTWGTFYGDNASFTPLGFNYLYVGAFASALGAKGRFYLAGQDFWGYPQFTYSDHQEAGSGIERIITNTGGTAILYSNGRFDAIVGIVNGGPIGSINVDISYTLPITPVSVDLNGCSGGGRPRTTWTDFSIIGCWYDSSVNAAKIHVVNSTSQNVDLYARVTGYWK